MRRQVTIHFNAATTAKIQQSTGNPDFAFQVFENVKSAKFSDGFLKIVVPSREDTIDGLAEYYYNASSVDRIKAIDLPD